MTLLKDTLEGILPQDAGWRKRATERLEQLTMPHWALGRLMDLGVELAGMTRSLTPDVTQRAVVVMAGDHGVAEQGVSKYPQAVTLQMVHNFVRGGAGINALARQARCDVIVVDMGVAGDLGELVESGAVVDKKVGRGTRNLAVGPAMSRTEAIRSVEAGIELAREFGPAYGLFGTGEMGIANTTPATAIGCVLTGETPATMVGRGTGLDDDALAHKMAVIERALVVNTPMRTDPLDVLAKVGGFEIGGLTGLILGAAAMRKPIVIDGFITTAAALLAQAFCPQATQYMIAAHRSEEPGHRLMLAHLGKVPLLDLGLRLGEGTGAALAMNLVDAATHVLTDVATFAEASVSEAE